MSDAELLVECKRALNMQLDNANFDGILNQKILAVKSFMKGAGVKDETMGDNLAVGVIVMGVVDLWEVQGGEVKFSPAFFTLLSQLAMR